jgi:hypothetical protein
MVYVYYFFSGESSLDSSFITFRALRKPCIICWQTDWLADPHFCKVIPLRRYLVFEGVSAGKRKAIFEEDGIPEFDAGTRTASKGVRVESPTVESSASSSELAKE